MCTCVCINVIEDVCSFLCVGGAVEGGLRGFFVIIV